MKTNKVYSNKYWEVKPFPESVEEGRTWREGMVGGNGENGFNQRRALFGYDYLSEY